MLDYRSQYSATANISLITRRQIPDYPALVMSLERAEQQGALNSSLVPRAVGPEAS